MVYTSGAIRIFTKIHDIETYRVEIVKLCYFPVIKLSYTLYYDSSLACTLIKTKIQIITDAIVVVFCNYKIVFFRFVSALK